MNVRKVRFIAVMVGYGKNERILDQRPFPQRAELEPIMREYNAALKPRKDGIRMDVAYLQPVDYFRLDDRETGVAVLQRVK